MLWKICAFRKFCAPIRKLRYFKHLKWAKISMMAWVVFTSTHFTYSPEVFNGGIKMKSHDRHTADVQIQHTEVPGEDVVAPLG